MLDQQVPVLGLHVTFSSLASPLEPLTEITWSGLEAETKAAWDHSNMQAAYPARWLPGEMTKRTMDSKSCAARKLMLAEKNGTTRSWCAHVTHVLLPRVPRTPRTQVKEKASTQDRGTYFQLSCLPGFAAIEKGRQELPKQSICSIGCDPTVTSQPSLSWVVRPRKHCLYSPSQSSLQPLVWQFPGKNVWSGDCFSPPCSLLRSFKVQIGMTFLSCSNYSQFGTHTLEDRKAFTWWVHKQALWR
jgi:hypothetical protein